MTPATEMLERLRRGERFRGAPAALINNGAPDQAALKLFVEALRNDGEAVREQVIKAVVALGRQLDPLQNAGGNLIRDRQIVSLLVKEGLAKPGATRDAALEALQQSVPAELLKEHAAELTAQLKRQPDTTLLLIIAKAKLKEASATVEALGRTAAWSGEEATLIARAALGEKSVEEKFVRAFLETQDPEQKAQRARTLGLIGTRAALQAVASELRNPLVIEMKMVMRRSVRLDLIAALSYNYPDKLFLFDNAILDDDGYARVEKFAEEEFGVRWEKPRPPFLTIQGFPSEPPG